MDINCILLKICNNFNLGYLLQAPQKMSGGFLHFVYKIITQNGCYVIKILNPDIMKRETALNNFNSANMLEKLLKQNQINAIYYNFFDCVGFDGVKYYFYIYDYFKGQSFFDKNLSKIHCEKIGEALAKIHNIKINKKNNIYSNYVCDWNFYIKTFENKDKQIYTKLKQSLGVLQHLCDNYNKNIGFLPKVETICHNDLDPKNVLWIDKEFMIIDLECLAFSSPYLELLETILQWSGINSLKINKRRFIAFKTSYFKRIKIDFNIDWNVVYYSNINMINWLEYNLKKYLSIIFCSETEKQKTKDEITKTLDKIIFYFQQKNTIIKLIKN